MAGNQEESGWSQRIGSDLKPNRWWRLRRHLDISHGLLTTPCSIARTVCVAALRYLKYR